MSIIGDLIGLRLLSRVTPGKGVVILAFIYLGFLCYGSIIGMILYIALCVFFFWMLVILPRKLDSKPTSWEDDPELKALRALREQQFKEANKRRKSNPYE